MTRWNTVKSARTEAGLTQRALAECAGVSLNTLHKIEQMVTKTTGVDTAIGIAEALKLPVESLFFAGNSQKSLNEESQ